MLARLARHVDELLAERWPPELIAHALTTWGAKGLDPATLPSVANEVANRASAPMAKRTEKALAYLVPEDRAAAEASSFGAFGLIEGDTA